MTVSRFIFLLVLLAGRPVLGHEFWIDARSYQIAPGAPITADLRNGEGFEGIALAWFDTQFTRFEVAAGGEIHSVAGRAGDTPALQIQPPRGDGFVIALHETTPATVTYRSWDSFMAFAAHKDFPRAAADHEAAGWPKDMFRESYTRHAKALIAVGHGAGADRAFGLETEFVALTNPYDPGFGGQMRVQLFYQGALRGDAQVEIFDKSPDGTVAVHLARTDAQGTAIVPVTPGHSYLFDAVVLRPSPEAGRTERAPVWETLWAALTFAVPE